MANINDKDAAALEWFEAEKARRLQDKIDAGEIVSETITVVCTRDEDAEEAKARALARHPAPDDGRPVHREFLYIFTGVPRGEHLPGQAPPQTTASEGPALPSEPAGSGVSPSPSQPIPTHVQITISNGNEDDPGQIVEAFYTIEEGLLVLRDRDKKFLTSRALLSGENPRTLARILLREAAPNDFQMPIRYKPWGIA
jgi:hypothetical protein